MLCFVPCLPLNSRGKNVYCKRQQHAILIVYVVRSNGSFIEHSAHSRDLIHSGLGTSEMNSILRNWEFFYLVAAYVLVLILSLKLLPFWEMLPFIVECFEFVFKAQLEELKHTNIPSQSTKRR